MKYTFNKAHALHSEPMTNMIESLDMRGETIEAVATAYEKLRMMQDHRNILVAAMAEVKTTVDNWEEKTESIGTHERRRDTMIKHDVDRLRDIVDWCLEETKKIRRKT